MVRTVCDSKLLVNELLKAMSHDYSSFTHAMNTSTYCLLLARRLGISDQDELLRIGQVRCCTTLECNSFLAASSTSLEN